MVTLDYQITTSAAHHHHHNQSQQQQHQQEENTDTMSEGTVVDPKEPPKSAVSTRSIEVKLSPKTDLAKKALKLDLVAAKDVDDFPIKSPKSPLSARIQHQTSISSQADGVEDRKTLRDALYQGIFHRHRRTIFAVGSFLRMLRSRNSQYNTIRSSSEGEDVEEEVR